MQCGDTPAAPCRVISEWVVSGHFSEEMSQLFRASLGLVWPASLDLTSLTGEMCITISAPCSSAPSVKVVFSYLTLPSLSFCILALVNPVLTAQSGQEDVESFLFLAIPDLRDRPAHSGYFWSWWSSCFKQGGVDDLQVFLQQTFLDSSGPAAQGYKISWSMMASSLSTVI